MVYWMSVWQNSKKHWKLWCIYRRIGNNYRMSYHTQSIHIAVSLTLFYLSPIRHRDLLFPERRTCGSRGNGSGPIRLHKLGWLARRKVTRRPWLQHSAEKKTESWGWGVQTGLFDDGLPSSSGFFKRKIEINH